MAITVKHKFVSAIPDSDDTSVVRPSNWNDDHDLTGTIPVANGGTGASTADGAVTNLLPSQTGNTGKYLTTDGTNTSWSANASGDVVGPTSATDNAIARFDTTTGKLIQNSVVTMDDTGATTGVTTLSASTSVTTPIVQASNSGGLALKNSGGTTQMSVGAGGGDNMSINVSTNLNGTNAQIDISPTGTGHVHIKPTGVNSVEIAPTFVGEMDNITIGSITPKAGTFTTITGQTEVLKGTGTNLLLQSQTFDNASWSKGNTTITAASTTAPDGTLTGQTFTAVSSGPTYYVLQNTTVASLTQTFSIYLKAGTITSVQLYCYAASGGTNTYTATFNISAGTVTSSSATGTSTLSSATITSVGNGWYRCILAGNVNSTGSQGNVIYTGNGNFYAWGAQLEIGSTANTYIPTTTTAVYGTPTLSFSGVAGLGLQSDGSLYVSPAGTGALQAQATTSSTVGGNARGSNAVDWQTARGAATQGASATGSVVVGGTNNLANGGYSAVVGGYGDNATGPQTFVGGGENNTASGTSASVVGGHLNTAAGRLNFIGGGETNSGTANAAVTTQTTTTVTSGSTAVTLSGSNAAIKIGQMVTGTGIQASTATLNYTYVAAISGTSLTLSQNATATGTPTLSFYTPHGVVVGGGNNQATGSYSFIGGGGDAGTAANRNIASGDWSTVAGGAKNTASGGASFVGGGGWNGSGVYNGNIASATSSAVVGGNGNQAVSSYTFVAAGFQNYAAGRSASVLSGEYGTTRNIVGNTVFAASQTPISATLGVQQAALLVLGVQTTDATATALRGDTAAAGTTNQVILPNNSAYYFKIEVIAGKTGAGDTKAWELKGAIKRGANAASTAIVGTVTSTVIAADAGAATWTVTATADTTNGGIKVEVTGQAATTIRWVARAVTTEMTY